MLDSNIQDFNVNINYLQSSILLCSLCQDSLTQGRRRHLLFCLLWGSLPAPLWLQNPEGYVRTRQEERANIYKLQLTSEILTEVVSWIRRLNIRLTRDDLVLLYPEL